RTTGVPESSLASLPVVSVLPANRQFMSTPSTGMRSPSISVVATSHSPWNGSNSADSRAGFPTGSVFGDPGAGAGVSFATSFAGPSLPGGPPASVAGPVNWRPAITPAIRTAEHAAPAFSFDTNMAVRTPSMRTTAEMEAALTLRAAAAVEAVSASGTAAGARAA